MELEAMASTTIGDVKETLEEETGIPASRQFLFFLDSDGNHQLDDDMVIKNDMHLQLQELIEVRVKDVDGTEFSLELSPRKSYDDVRDAIAAKRSIRPSELRLSMSGENLNRNYIPSTGDVLTIEVPRVCVELPDGARVFIPMLPTSTIADLKASIEHQSGIPSGSQKITFSQDEAGLANDTLLSLPKFFDGSVLRVQPEIPEVTVNTHDGRSFVMKMDPKDTRNDVRYKIGKEIGIPTQDLRLSKDGAPLDKKYKPKKGDILTVEGQRIRVELPDNSRIEISVMPTQSLGEVKDAIEKISGISKADQRLFFANGKAELDDHKAVSKYGLDESLVLQVRLPDRPPSVQVELPDGRTLMLDVDPGKTLDHLKAQLSGEIGLLLGTLDLNGKSLKDLDGSKTLTELGVRVKDGDKLRVGQPFVETTLPDGSQIHFEAAPTMTIRDLKAFAVLSLPNARESDLRVLSPGRLDPLDDATSFDKLDFTKGLRVEMEPIRATVKLPGTAAFASVVCRRDEKIVKLKERLAREHNLDASDVLLFQCGTELDDSHTVSESNVKQDCELELAIFQFQVMVMDSSGGDILTIDDMPQAATIGHLKQRLAKEKGIPNGKQLLHLNDILLDDGDKGLRECGVKHMSVLVLEKAEEKEIQISIEHWNGDIFTVEAKPSDSIDSIKEKVAALTNIPPEQQTLTYENASLEIGTNLHERGIGNRSELKLKHPQIYVTLPSGETRSVPVELDCTIKRVKELLSASGALLDVDDQNLIKGDEYVENGSTLGECGVKIGDTLVLEPFSVSVLCWSGDVVELVGVRSKDTVDDVKKILLEKTSVPEEKQRIMRGGEALDDEKRTLAGYGVQHKDTLLLDNPDKFETTPSSPRKGKSPFSFLQKATNLLASPKAKSSEVEQYVGDDQELVSITVITPELNSIKLKMDPNISASECRKMISKGVGVPLDELRLSKFGEAVDDAYTPENGEVLTVEPSPTVNVRLPDGSKLELSVSPTTTIEDLKECLEDETGISKGDQKLFIGKGKHEEEAPDDLIISDDIELRLVGPDVEGSQEEGSENDYEEAEEDAVEYDEVPVAETILNDGDADRNGEKEAEDETIVGSADHHVLSSPKRKLDDGKAKEYKSKPLEITIQDSKGTQHTVLFQKEATVEELKYKIPSHAVKAANMVDLCVLLNGKELDADKTLDECGVTDGDVLLVEAYALQIMHFLSVVLPFDTVSRLDTVGAVKEKLAVQQSIPKHQQKLSMEGDKSVLDDNKKTLKEYGIKHKTVLILQEDTGAQGSKAKDPRPRGEDPDERAKNLDDRIAKIKERAEARRMARMSSGR
jgi:Ubiquitin family/Ubiquitin-like domain